MAENTNLHLTVDAWADIVTANWIDKLQKLKIGYDFSLENSIGYELFSSTGGIPERVEFVFNYYGKFVDMGVGKGVSIGDVKSQRGENVGSRYRRPKRWYSKELYSQTLKLQEILAKKYGRIASLVIVENIDDNSLYHSGKFL